ncbi:uncharacterized protein LOC110866670 [Helianthus annuus]|uniref:uncharacterized protein LOC110866670 n=1 Tax=Helianthus annuus TaxID=4232 RepID=UPI000B8F9B39|nr:uncharacterized protein LOC110866670 [Helianthus annuus]
MGFPGRWCSWIKGILESARSSVLDNGSSTFEFQCQKGLRQGDPISPFLFIMVVEMLSCMIDKAISVDALSGIQISNGMCVSHLLYVDNAIILGELFPSNIRNVSNIYAIGVQLGELNNMVAAVGCQVGIFPFKYLGLMVGANMNQAPVQVIKDLEVKMRNFLWGGDDWVKKLYWVAWDRVSLPKKNDGLGLSSIKSEKDEWEWIGAADKDFSTKAVKKLLDNSRIRSDVYVPEGGNSILSKCNIFVWREKMGKIATMDALKKRNIGDSNTICGLCEEGEESVDHLFTSCYFASMLWSFISSWCKSQNIVVFSFKDLIEVHNHFGLNRQKIEAINGLIRTGCWVIWRSRNEARFRNKPVKLEGIISEVKNLGFCGIRLEIMERLFLGEIGVNL